MLDKLKNELERNNLGKVYHYLAERTKDSIRLTKRFMPDEEILPGQSKIGGLPDTAKGFSWPEKNELSLAFIAQINLSDASAHESSGLLPTRGLLCFFVDYEEQPWGFDPKDIGGWKVFCFDESPENLVKAKAPENLCAEKPFPSALLSFQREEMVMNWESFDERDAGLTEAEGDRVRDILMDLVDEDVSINRILGYPDAIQDPDMELECQLVTNGLYCGDETGYTDSNVEELKKGVEDWVLLLQVDSDGDKGEMSWGDDGRIYFWVRRQELRKKVFNNVWMILQCG